jgi:hypothetical protein
LAFLRGKISFSVLGKNKKLQNVFQRRNGRSVGSSSRRGEIDFSKVVLTFLAMLFYRVAVAAAEGEAKPPALWEQQREGEVKKLYA